MMKTYHIHQGEACQAENKMRYVESQLTKAVTDSKRTGSKKIKAFEKKLEGVGGGDQCSVFFLYFTLGNIC